MTLNRKGGALLLFEVNPSVIITPLPPLIRSYYLASVLYLLALADYPRVPLD